MRALDLAIAVPALVATGPLVLGLAAAVKLTSRGPAFFVQERVGRAKQTIKVVKLRTMTYRAKGADFTSAGDPRVTPLGRLLRKAKLDELPQLWNVVRGDLSLVGPRPETPAWVARYRPEWERVFTVRPGITDLASIAFRDEESLLALARDKERAYRDVILPLKLELALGGIGRGPLHDLGVLLATAREIVFPKEHPAIARARRHIEAL